MDKKDLQEIENIIDKKLDEKLDVRFAKLIHELSEVLNDFTYTIDKRFANRDAMIDKKFDEMEAKFNKRFDIQDQKIDELNRKFDIHDKKLMS